MNLVSFAEAVVKFLDITLGNVISWVVMISAIGAAWQKISSRQDAMDAHLKRQDEQLEVMLDVVPKLRETTAVDRERLDQYHKRLGKVEDVIVAIQRVELGMATLSATVATLSAIIQKHKLRP